MKTVHQLFHEFQQLKKPSDSNYIKLGHDLAKSIVVEPKNQHDLLWQFVREKFPKYKSDLIVYGATFYSESESTTEAVSDKSEELKPIVTKIDTVKEELPIDPKSKVKEEIVESNKKVEEIDEHKEKIAQKVSEIQESVAKIDNNIQALKEIKDPGFSMKMAIEALEKFRDEMNNKYKPKKPK